MDHADKTPEPLRSRGPGPESATPEFRRKAGAAADSPGGAIERSSRLVDQTERQAALQQSARMTAQRERIHQLVPVLRARTPETSPVGDGVIQRKIGHGAPIGTQVVDKTFGELYRVARIDGGVYTLVHLVRKGVTVTAEGSDENFDVFGAPPAQPQQQGTGLFNQIGSALSGLFGREDTTASPAYAKAKQTDIARAWPPSSLSREVRAISAAAEQVERQCVDSQAFYTAAGLGAHALHRILQTIHETYGGVGVNDFVFHRSPSNRPRGETLLGPATFLEQTGKPGWSDHQERDSLMSANLALKANASDTSESTFDILQSGGLFDVSVDKTLEIVREQLKSMALTAEQARPILDAVQRLAVAMDKAKSSTSASSTSSSTGGASRKEAVLYQILVPHSLVDQLVYVAAKNGQPLDKGDLSTVKPEEVLAGIAEAGRDIGDASLQSFGESKSKTLARLTREEAAALLRGAEFTRMTLKAARSPAFWAKIRSADPQARLLMHPDYFSRPTGFIRTITHSNVGPQTEDTLRQGLDAVASATSLAKAARIKDSILNLLGIYGQLWERHGRDLVLEDLPIDALHARLARLRGEAQQIDAQIDRRVWTPVSHSQGMKDFLNSRPEVLVRGEKERYDLTAPQQMTAAELEAFIERLQAHRNGVPKPSAPQIDLLGLDAFDQGP